MRRSMHRLAACVTVLLVASAAPSAASDWPQHGYDGGHSGFNRLERRLTPRSVEGLHLTWQRRMAPKGRHGYEHGSSVTVVRGGRAFVSWTAEESGSLLAALDATDGTLLWRHRYANGYGRFVASTPDAVIANFAHRVIAFAPKTGDPIWTRRAAVSSATPTGSVLFVTFAGRPVAIGAISGVDGAVLWRRAVRTSGEPMLSRGVLLVTARDGRGPCLFAMDPGNGATLWRRATRRYDYLSLASGGTAYLLARVDAETVRLKALRVSDGERLWARPLRAKTDVFVWTADDARVFVERVRCASGCEGDAFGDYRGSLLALHASSGETAWRLDGGIGTGAPLWTAEAVTRGLVYVDRFRFGRVRVAALDLSDGHVRWSASFGERTYGQVTAVANGRVFVGMGSGYSAHPNSGGRVYVFALP